MIKCCNSLIPNELECKYCLLEDLPAFFPDLRQVWCKCEVKYGGRLKESVMANRRPGAAHRILNEEIRPVFAIYRQRSETAELIGKLGKKMYACISR